MAVLQDTMTLVTEYPVLTILICILVYGVSLVFYRLLLHPLSNFPGPKLAAATLWYEFYHDVVRNGQYTFEIKRMHEIYGTFNTPILPVLAGLELLTLCFDRPHSPHQSARTPYQRPKLR